MKQVPVVIVGGGLAGINAARQLESAGVDYLLLESQDRLGGRIRTEHVDGYAFDIGFQVLLTSYPEAQAAWDYDRLRLGRFQPGALIRFQNGFQRWVDPWREPRSLLTTALSPLAGWGDKWRIARRRWRSMAAPTDRFLQQAEVTTAQRLQSEGFSARVVESFFRPFFSGVFLESELKTSSRKFEYLFDLFSRGHAALPSGGMERIVHHLAEGLDPARQRLGTRVAGIRPGSVSLQDGHVIQAIRIVLAVDPWTAGQLLPEGTRPFETPAAHSVTVFYYSADQPPVRDPILVLNGTGQGPINSLCVPSQVAEGYAPAGKSLISVTVLGSSFGPGAARAAAADEPAVRAQLREWFGTPTDDWRFLKAFQVPRALPAQEQISWTDAQPRFAELGEGLFVCGDAHDIASIQGALRSGREVGNRVAMLSANRG